MWSLLTTSDIPLHYELKICVYLCLTKGRRGLLGRVELNAMFMSTVREGVGNEGQIIQFILVCQL